MNNFQCCSIVSVGLNWSLLVSFRTRKIWMYITWFQLAVFESQVNIELIILTWTCLMTGSGIQSRTTDRIRFVSQAKLIYPHISDLTSSSVLPYSMVIWNSDLHHYIHVPIKSTPAVVTRQLAIFLPNVYNYNYFGGYNMLFKMADRISRHHGLFLGFTLDGPAYMGSSMPQAGMKSGTSNYVPWVYLECNHLSLSLIHVSGTQVLIYSLMVSMLIHYDLVTPYGDRNLCQRWIR